MTSIEVALPAIPAVKGKIGQKVIGGRQMEAQPVVAACDGVIFPDVSLFRHVLTGQRRYVYRSMGVGLLIPEDNDRLIPMRNNRRTLIESWRTMEFLNGVKEVECTTIGDAYVAANYSNPEQSELSTRYKTAESRLVQSMGSEGYRDILERVRDSVPPQDVLDQMIEVFNIHGVPINDLELRKAVENGKLKKTDTIDQVIQRNEERRTRQIEGSRETSGTIKSRIIRIFGI